MSTLKILALASALALGTSSVAMAQMSGSSGSTQQNAAASGGSGTHQSAPKTGGAANMQKNLKNQNGYRPQ